MANPSESRVKANTDNDDDQKNQEDAPTTSDTADMDQDRYPDDHHQPGGKVAPLGVDEQSNSKTVLVGPIPESKKLNTKLLALIGPPQAQKTITVNGSTAQPIVVHHGELNHRQGVSSG